MSDDEDDEPQRITIDNVGMQCGTCFYRDREGRCRRGPATMTREPNATVRAFWPKVESGDVCGEWHTDQQPPERLGLAEVPQ